MTDAWSQSSIDKELAAYIGTWARNIPATASGTVTTYLIYKATMEFSSAIQSTKIVKTMYMHNNGHIALWLTIMQGQQSLTLQWHSFSRWDSECFAFSVYFEGGQYSIYGYLQRIAPQITQDTRPMIGDASLTLIFQTG